MQAAADARTFSEQVSIGQGLFAKHCAGCHGAAGEGKKAPALVGLESGALPVDPPADRKFRKSRFVSVADVAVKVSTRVWIVSFGRSIQRWSSPFDRII